MKKYLLFFVIIFFVNCVGYSQTPNFGNNKECGKYVKVQDATIYYEIYGTGEPLILLHGGLFGDISDFKELIPLLKNRFKVIAIDTRGHGKSEIGDRPFTYDILAEDVYEVTKKITNGRITIVGYSDGGLIAFKFATKYPELVKKIICLPGILFSPKDYKENALRGLESQTGDFFEKNVPAMVGKQKSLMPEPNRWNDFVEKLKNAWLQPVYFENSEIHKLTSPLLIICGDRDEWVDLETVIKNYKQFKNAQISVIPNCGHALLKRTDDIAGIMIRFLGSDFAE